MCLVAQDNSNGLAVTLTYAEGLGFEDDETFLTSRFGLGLNSETRNQTFRLNLSTDLDKSLEDGFEADFDDPTLSLAYGLENRSSALGFDLRFRRSDIDTLVSNNDVISPALVDDEGTREVLSSQIRFETGRDAPFGATFTLGYTETNFLDTASTSVDDSTDINGSGTLRFDINPQISARIGLALSELDRESSVDVRRESLSFGASILLNPVWNADVELGFTKVTQSGSIPRSVEDGISLTLALSRAMKNGALSGTLQSNLDENGRRTSLQINRELALRGGDLGFGFGLSEDDDSGDIDPLYSLSYNYDLPRGTFNASFQQQFSSDDVGVETLNSLLRVSTSQDLTPRDRITARASLNDSNRQGMAIDTQQFDIGFDYSRELTQDWALTGSYTHSRNTDSNGSDQTDDTLFLGLQTRITWLP